MNINADKAAKWPPLRFESTVQEARDVRESIVGSFEVLIARTCHRTNHIMKVLTLTSVILLFRVRSSLASWG